jgi:citrate lyase subunit beta / citryl-CoA lyase
MDRMRSWMFVPGNVAKMIDKAFACDADAIMLDLEDGVVPEMKASARLVVAASLAKPRTSRSPTRFVRVNGPGTSDLLLDLRAVVVPGLQGLTVPKVETVDEIRYVSAALEELERERGLQHGSVRLMLAIETVKGLFASPVLASASQRVIGLMFGAEDFSTDVGLPTVRAGIAREFLFARSMIVYAAASADVSSVDAVWPDLRDLDGLKRDAEMARALGFRGKSMVHPGHIDVVNTVFTPSESEISFSRGLITEFEKAVADGKGSISFAGKLVDRPIYARAVGTMRLAERIGLDKTK